MASAADYDVRGEVSEAEVAVAVHTAIVTGANHGIGAATASALARRGCAVLCTFLRLDDPVDPGTPQSHRDRRAQGAGPIVAQIRAEGGQAATVEADLSDPGTPAMLFDIAEEQLGPDLGHDRPGALRTAIPVRLRRAGINRII